MTDTWWWHAAGVLSLLRLAQRLGKPTAMFGQGVGPISGRRGGSRALRAQARAVLPRLAVLGLREDRIGKDLAISLGISSSAMAVTGDDALELIPEGSAVEAAQPTAVLAAAVFNPAGRWASACGSRPTPELTRRRRRRSATWWCRRRKPSGHAIVTLPVSRYPVDGDLDALRALLHPERSGAGIVLHDLATPEALITAAADCRVIVTGSYHAAVFGLARGVPAVCLTRSSYYDAKFAGLRRCSPAPASSSPLTSPISLPGWARPSTRRGTCPSRRGTTRGRQPPGSGKPGARPTRGSAT